MLFVWGGDLVVLLRDGCCYAVSVDQISFFFPLPFALPGGFCSLHLSFVVVCSSPNQVCVCEREGRERDINS